MSAGQNVGKEITGFKSGYPPQDSILMSF